MSKKLVVVVAAALLLGGCASGVKRSPTMPASRITVSSTEQISKVTLSLTNEAKKKAISNLKLDTNKLLDVVKRAMDAHSLLSPAADAARPNLEIQVTDLRMRSTFSAIMWGAMAGSDYVTADIVIRDAEGKELDRFEVSASYALGGYMGFDESRLSWLYENFAKETVKELTRSETQQVSQK